jgi:hypothetical protein
MVSDWAAGGPVEDAGRVPACTAAAATTWAAAPEHADAMAIPQLFSIKASYIINWPI